MKENKTKKIKEISTLIKRLSVLVLIGIGIYIVIQVIKGGSPTNAKIDETPIRVEQIRSILELNTIRFRDEVVVDTVEYYKDSWSQSMGVLEKLTDFNTMDEALKSSPIKRRLTLVVKGEMLYGVDLKTKDFDIIEKNDTIVLQLPEPTLLSVSVNPSNTDVFVENGVWSDYARRKLMIKAKKKMIASGEQLHLTTKAKEPLEKCLKQLIKTEKPLKIEYLK